MRLTLPLFFPSLPPLEEPIRAELFGIERLEQHAGSLAAAQTVTTGLEPKRPLLPRVDENGRVLREANRSIADAVREERWITPAAEWLLDNFFVVDEQLREHPRRPAGRLLSRAAGARRRSAGRLSRGCTASRGPSSRTPTAASIPTPFAGSCARTSGCSRSRSANSGPSRSRCAWCWWRTCGALADAMVRGREARREADALADELLGRERARRAIGGDGDVPRGQPAAGHGVRGGTGAAAARPGSGGDAGARLAAPAARGAGDDGRRDRAREHQRQAAMTVTVRNIITSMRLMSALDWTAFFESVSLVDEALRERAATSRRWTSRAGTAIATRSRRCRADRGARSSTSSGRRWRRPSDARARPPDAVAGGDDRRADPGFYLVGGGRQAFERAVGFRPPLGLRLRRAFIDRGDAGIPGLARAC